MKARAPVAMRGGDRFERIERLLGRVLGVGAAASTGLLAVGLAAWMLGWRTTATARLFDAGLAVLMATPIARVVVSLAEWARERDWLFVATTLTVLAVLAGTIYAAFGASPGGG
jgi:hypothetical protein